MNTAEFERGIPDDKHGKVAKVLAELTTEVIFVPLTQSNIVVPVDQLQLLMQAARDGLLARSLYEDLDLAAAELKDIGRSDAVIPGYYKVLEAYETLHSEGAGVLPQISNQV